MTVIVICIVYNWLKCQLSGDALQWLGEPNKPYLNVSCVVFAG